MKPSNSNSSNSKPRRQRPSETDEGREQQLQALAMDLAYERLLNKTASNQLICEILRSASTERKLKKEIMNEQKKLIAAKTQAIEDQKDIKELYTKALNAFRVYSGGVVDEEDIF